MFGCQARRLPTSAQWMCEWTAGQSPCGRSQGIVSVWASSEHEGAREWGRFLPEWTQAHIMEKETAALRKSLTAQKEKVRGIGERKKQNAFVSLLKVAQNRIMKYFWKIWQNHFFKSRFLYAHNFVKICHFYKIMGYLCRGIVFLWIHWGFFLKKTEKAVYYIFY